MWRTAEIRWWWQDQDRTPLGAWLFQGVEPLKDFRTDIYLADAEQTDIGVKRRNREAVEVKMLYGLPDISLPEPMTGQAELWVKAESVALPLGEENTVAVGKQRRRRIIGFTDGEWHEEVSEDDCEQGVALEITDVEIGGDKWLTCGFEAFGGEDTIVSLLQQAVTLFGVWPPDVGGPDIVGGYPLWLAERANAADR